MNVYKKITLFKLLILLCFSSFAGEPSKTPATSQNPKSSSCIGGISSFTSSLMATTPCSKYKFTLIIFGVRALVTINYGDGSPQDSVKPIIPDTMVFIHQYTTPGTYTVTATHYLGCAPPVTATLTVGVTCSGGCPNITSFTNLELPTTIPCQKFEFNAAVFGLGAGCDQAIWNWGDGSPNDTTCANGAGVANVHLFTTSGTYTVTLTIVRPGTACITKATLVVSVNCGLPCIDCIGSFAPIPGRKYLISAWVKEDNAPQSKTSYNFPSITIQYPSIASSSGPFSPSGLIIDGWQKIEAEFTIPSTTTDMKIKLDCSGTVCFFDDIRVFPYDGSLKSYVYNPFTMRLVAELDERNYATFYEYDEEGKLTRVKKETEKGKMTIQENRNNTKK